MLEKIINLCPTGTLTTKENSLAPIYQYEIIDDVLACLEVGISVVHLHARDEHGQNTYKKENMSSNFNFGYKRKYNRL